MTVEETIDINFNSPFEVTEIFRFREDHMTGNKILDEEGELVDETEVKMPEFKRQTFICWETIKEIGGYPYKDDWSIKCEKYFVKFHNQPTEMLVLGNMGKTVALWKLFRNLYPFGPPAFKVESIKRVQPSLTVEEPENDQDGVV